MHARRQDIVLSMEMFERDVQGVLDDYLRGRIDEESFLDLAFPLRGRLQKRIQAKTRRVRHHV